MRSRRLIAILSTLVGCSASPAPSPSPPLKAPVAERVTPIVSKPPHRSTTPSAPAAEPEQAPPPEALAGDLVELEVDGHEPAVLSLPGGATGPRPVLVATHGAGGRALTHCRIWRSIVGDRGFVLCPRGRSMYPALSHHRDRGYYYPGHPALKTELEAALAALAARYPDHVDAEAPIFAGYSQGAGMGALAIPEHSAHFARLALVEGGVGEHQEWNLAVARRFREQGGERVMLVCGRLECHRSAQTTARHMERVGLGARVLYAAGAGHRYDGEVRRLVAESFAWLVEGDGRWSEGRRALSRTSPTHRGSASVSGSARHSRTTTR